MAEPRYPMLRRRRRRRRWRLPRLRIARSHAIALAVLAAALAIAAVIALRPAGPVDPVRAMADARKAYGIGNYSAARNHALAALRSDPQSQPAMLLLARSYLELGDGQGAEGALSRARALRLPAVTLAGLHARTRVLQGDYGGAIDAAAAAPADDGDAIRARARATAMQGDAGAGSAMLRTWLAAHPDNAGGWIDLARIRQGAGDIAGATAATARAARLAPGDPVPLTQQALIVRTRYGLTAALPWFEAALKRDAYYHPALVEYAATLGEAGRYADMLAATRRALAAQPGSPQAFYLQAVLAARAGRPALARDLLQRAGPGALAMPGPALLDGALDLVAGQYERAIDSWGQIADAQPLNLVVRRLIAAALLRSGDAAGALDRLRPLVQRGDADAYALTLAARAAEALGDRAAAAIPLDRAAAGATGAAVAFASEDGIDATIADARDDPGDPNAVLGVIRAQLATGNRAAAIAQARRLVAASPGSPPAQLALGDALASDGQFADAARSYAIAASLAFDEPTMLRLVDAWGRAGRPQEAAAALSLYLQQNPQSLTGQRIRGHWQVANDPDAAIETLEGVRRIAGNRDAALLADLASAYAASDAGAVARRYGRAAYALAPMNAGVCDAYAVALAADGDLPAARQLATKALALAPADPLIAAHARQILR